MTAQRGRHASALRSADLHAVGAAIAGNLDRHKLGFAERAIVIALRGPEGGYRHWHDIRAWAATIAEDLRTRSVA